MHTINLTAAWDQIDLPDGGIVWSRQFGRPTGIEPPLQVWLVAEPALLDRMWLNGGRLDATANQGRRVLITDRLTVHNRLLVPPAGLSAVEIAAIASDLVGGRLVSRRSALPADLGRVMLAIVAGDLDFRLP